MRRLSLTLATAFTCVGSLVAAGGAQAIVVNDNGTTAGVRLIPYSSVPAGVTTSTSTSPCDDPWLSSDFGGPALPSDGLCYRGGPVINSNETFDIAWDPLRRDWATTRDYLEQFMRNVSDASGSLSSPYAVTTQYRDSSGRAGNSSVYGGGCIDYGSTGGSSCQFGNEAGTGAGHDYPATGCPVSGMNQFHEDLSGAWDDAPNDVCVTDAQIQNEVSDVVSDEGIVGRTEPGHTPLVVLYTPPGVVVCLDASANLCSANGNPIPAPTAPSLSTANPGGSIGPGAYEVAVSYMIAGGESVASIPAQLTVTSTSSTIAVTSPAAETGATGWYAYVSADHGLTWVRQGGGQTIGTALTLTSLNASGPAPAPNPGFICSYHSQVNVGGTNVAYVVLPWVASWDIATGCTEPDASALPTPKMPALSS
jgi:hypothetical protein